MNRDNKKIDLSFKRQNTFMHNTDYVHPETTLRRNTENLYLEKVQ